MRRPRGGGVPRPYEGKRIAVTSRKTAPIVVMSRFALISLQLLVAVVVVLLWQLLTTLPIGKWLIEGSIWHHLWITLIEAVLAFVIGAIGGILVGFSFARQPRLAAVFDPYVKMINALPRIVLAPMFALWLGLGIWSKVALGVTLVFP